MDYENITDNVYALVNWVNTTAFVLPSQIVMIDSGARRPPSEMQKARQKIEEIANRPVKTMILTHFHSDHTHGLPLFSDCTIIASTLLVKRLKDAKRKPLHGFPVTFPTNTFEDNMEMQDGEVRLIIKRTGGHTDDSTYIYCPNFRVLVTGDNLMPGYPWGGKGTSLHHWINAFQEYLNLDVDIIIPGHGPLWEKNQVKARLDFMLQVKETMQELINKGRSKEEVLTAVTTIPYEPPLSPHAKSQVLQRWYQNWKMK